MDEEEECWFDREDDEGDDIDPIEECYFEPNFTEKTTKIKGYPVDPVKSIVNKSPLNARKMPVTPTNNTTSPVIEDDNQTNNKRKSAAAVSYILFSCVSSNHVLPQTPLVDYPDEDSEEDEEEDEEDEEEAEEAMTEAKRPRLMS